MAENERINIRQRQAEGIAAAKARGVRFGRPNRKLPANFDEVVRMWENKEIGISEAVRLSGVPQTTFYRYAKKK